MAPRNRVGFTLVELLVVVAIIAVLIGLLMPAVMSARNRARVAQCAHYQQELGKAMLSYESAKGYFPGYKNILAGGTVSWAPLMLPHINRNDLWAGSTGWRNGDKTAGGLIEQFVCPSDPSTDNNRLSFVVNLGTSTMSGDGVFRDRTQAATKSVSLSDIQSASRRPMIAEAILYDTNGNQIDRPWTNTGSTITAERFGFVWPATSIPVIRPPVAGATGALLPIHNGVINVTFCDGHTETLSEDRTCDEFDSSPIK